MLFFKSQGPKKTFSHFSLIYDHLIFLFIIFHISIKKNLYSPLLFPIIYLEEWKLKYIEK